MLQGFDRSDVGKVAVGEPERCVVLGRATPVRDVYVGRCVADGVPVYRRKGGGGAVVLAPGMLVISTCFSFSSRPDATMLISGLAETIIQALTAYGQKSGSRVQGLSIRGFGDVCIGDRKIVGSSLYFGKDLALYQASLLVRDSAGIINRYLDRPSAEPEYRRGRTHDQFVTSLEQENIPADSGALTRELTGAFRARWLLGKAAP